MLKPILTLVAGIALGVAGTMAATHFAPRAAQPYAGQDARAISSLSAQDQADLLDGAGWGLAKPAELNGYPGPAHILEHADALDLTPDQKAQIDAIFAAMQAAAKTQGAKLIEAEAALDAIFKDETADPATLNTALTHTEAARRALRYVHLSAHLESTPVLSRHQRALYQDLRGYGGGHSGHQGH